MRVPLRLLLVLVLVFVLADAASAQDAAPLKKAGPTAFDLPPLGMRGAPGVRARYGETIARLQQRLTKDPGDVDALIDLWKLSNTLGRVHLLDPVARAALKAKLEEADHTRVRGVLGLTLVARANALGTRFGGMIIFINGRIQPQPGRQLSDEQKKLFTEAEGHLRVAVLKNSRTPELRDALADTIQALDGGATPVKEATELSRQADAIRARRPRSMPAPDVYAEQAARLVDEASALEQTDPEPKHARAMELRKKSMVLDFCADAIPFDFSEVLYGPVSLLAPKNHLNQYLTRSFTTKKGEVEFIAPRVHVLPYARKAKLISTLGKDGTNGADAILVALVRGSSAATDPIADAATNALADGEHPSLRAGLPVLLARALFSGNQDRFPLAGQRALVKLAERVNLKEAAGVLAVAMARDNDLYWPRGIARTLGYVGGAEQAALLLERARDSNVNIYFRREAARAAVLLNAEAATALAEVQDVAIAVAAAMAERGDTNAHGRLLNGFSNDLEIDEAAMYCAELGIKEALPAMEAFLREYGEKKDHVARLVVVRALAELKRR